MKKKSVIFPAALLIIAAFSGAAPSNTFDAGFLPSNQSAAYKQYSKRPKTELSKLVYLIDRFSEAKIKINYDGYFYDSVFSAKIAKWFLARRYRGQNAKEWIFLWCDKTIPAGNLIWVVDAKENVRLSRDVLMEELKNLENITPAISPLPAADASVQKSVLAPDKPCDPVVQAH